MMIQTDNRKEVMEKSRAALPDHIVAFIEACNSGPYPHSQLISVLHKVQAHFGYLGKEQLDAVAQLMQIPTAKVTGVATFYHYFRLEPQGKFTLRVCLGTACYVKGAERVVERLRDELGIGFGETTSDGLFSLEASRCLGACGLAPVVMVGERIYGEMTPDKVPALLESFVKQAEKEQAAQAEE
ncbi:MAG TPA: NADH-quinone oxidoreductase subunit NuoE [Candidatus Hydrogenedentes bacterium]|nr:NADH-quinone oxidoreductase subunit NuoE [Candidatus Hydrogenedentota bacterium]